MKKFLIILMMILLVLPCFARTYTEEEFKEVYDALSESTVLLEESRNAIAELQEQVSALKESNEKLVAQLESSQTELEKANSLLEKAQENLESSTKVIDTLNNQKFLLGGGLAVSSSFLFGAKINAGYKLWVGYLAGEFSIYNDKSFNFGVSYNIIF